MRMSRTQISCMGGRCHRYLSCHPQSVVAIKQDTPHPKTPRQKTKCMRPLACNFLRCSICFGVSGIGVNRLMAISLKVYHRSIGSFGVTSPFHGARAIAC